MSGFFLVFFVVLVQTWNAHKQALLLAFKLQWILLKILTPCHDHGLDLGLRKNLSFLRVGSFGR